ncbi:hypothetical protein ACNKHX_17010 [Shigella flexneri]
MPVICLKSVTRVVVERVRLLSLTGKGHHTDIAIIMAWRVCRIPWISIPSLVLLGCEYSSSPDAGKRSA